MKRVLSILVRDIMFNFVYFIRDNNIEFVYSVESYTASMPASRKRLLWVVLVVVVVLVVAFVVALVVCMIVRLRFGSDCCGCGRCGCVCGSGCGCVTWWKWLWLCL